MWQVAGLHELYRNVVNCPSGCIASKAGRERQGASLLDDIWVPSSNPAVDLPFYKGESQKLVIRYLSFNSHWGPFARKSRVLGLPTEQLWLPLENKF